jgi:hypothetical protein
VNRAAPARDVKPSATPEIGPSVLRVSRATDAHEREADHAAEQVVSGKANTATWSLSRVGTVAPLQRECSCGGSCDDCQQKNAGTLQRAAAVGTSPVVAPPLVQRVLSGSGRSLDRKTRSFMESQFGHDFGNVRIFNDEAAATSARAISANAYTVGDKIVFSRGKYAPESASGRRLLAHELAHVVQQSNGTPPRSALPGLTSAAPGVIQRDADEDSKGPIGLLGQAKYLVEDAASTANPVRWLAAKKCLEGLFPAMRSETFETWIPVACARTKSGILHSREWDAFGHCWIACEGTRKCGGPQTWVLGLGRELSREWESRTGGKHHDSLSQDISNQLIGRVASIQAGTCFAICDSLHKNGHLNLSAPEGTCVDCNKQDAGEGPCPGAAAPAGVGP